MIKVETSAWMVAVLAGALMTSLAQAIVMETFEGPGTTPLGASNVPGGQAWDGSNAAPGAIWTPITTQPPGFRSDTIAGMDIVAAPLAFTTEPNVSIPSQAFTVTNGPSAPGSQFMGDVDLGNTAGGQEGRGMRMVADTPFQNLKLDWYHLGVAAWVQVGNASGAAFGFRAQSSTFEVNTYGNGSEIAVGHVAAAGEVDANGPDGNKLGWFTLDIAMSSTDPTSVGSSGSFTVEMTRHSDGMSWQLAQDFLGGVNVPPADNGLTDFAFNTGGFGGRAYDGGPIDTVWFYVERGNHNPGVGSGAGGEPKAAWDNVYTPEPATAVLFAAGACLVLRRRRDA